MTKITLQDVASFTNEPSALATVNNNSAIIETASDNFLSRDGTSPNQMTADLDMNNNNILNLPAPGGLTEPLRLQDLQSFLGGGQFIVNSPGGSSGQVQYNNGTTFGGDAGLTYNAGTDTLTVVNLIVSNETLTSGLRVGFAGASTANRIELGDATFYLDHGTSNTPNILWDTTDTFGYTRSTNTFNWTIGGSNTVLLNATTFVPGTNDGNALGSTANSWSDLFLASGGVINFANSDITITHSADTLTLAGATVGGFQFANTISPTSSGGASVGTSTLPWGNIFLTNTGFIDWGNNDIRATGSANTLTFTGAATGYLFDAVVRPTANDGAALGSATVSFSDLFLASGAVLNFNNGAYTVTQAAGDLSFSGSITCATQIGGTGTGSTLTLESTSGAGTTDRVIFKTASQVFAGAINTSQQWTLGADQTPSTGTRLTVNKNTAAPAAITGNAGVLHLLGADSVQPQMIFDAFSIGSPFIVTRSAAGTGSAFTATPNGQALGFFGMVGATANNTWAATDGSAGGVYFGGRATEQWSSTNQGCKLEFTTTTNGTNTTATRATLHNTGGFGVGTSTDPGLGGIGCAASIRCRDATAIPAGGTAGSGYTFSSTTNFGIFFGSGAPSLSAAKGSLYLRSDGTTTNDRAYINTNGTTTWTALTTAA